MEYKKTTHWGHLIITLLFFPWFLIWMACAASDASHNKKVDRWKEDQERKKRDEELDYLRRIVDNTGRRG